MTVMSSSNSFHSST